MTLQLIAAHMRQQVQIHKQPIRYKLERGLHLTLWRDGEDWILSMTRYGALPSEAEIKACRVAFTVPDQAAAETDRARGWQIIRLRWREMPGQAQLFEPPAAPPGHNYREDQ